MTSYASVLTITAFSIERWLAICFPFKIQLFSKLDRALKVIACIWLVALLAASPLFRYTSLYRLPLPFNSNDSNASSSSSIVNYSSFSDDGMTVRMTEKCTLDVNDRTIQNVLIGVSFWLFFIVPYLLISILYLNIGSVLRKNASNNIAHDSISDQHSRRKIRHRKNTVVRMLVAVVVTFFVCWLPFHIQRLSTIYINFESLNPFIMECFNHLFFVSGYFYYANAVVNPILYSIMNKKFRQALCSTLTCRQLSESSAADHRRRLRGLSEDQCLMARFNK
uniref:G-protein coupled receptors family 1 profile domain-containing protein n=1 Tax=Romanomermis culicivorax TaxID=13658 RepID=A0A915KMU3_ROMCU